jgi:hypothetical protein
MDTISTWRGLTMHTAGYSIALVVLVITNYIATIVARYVGANMKMLMRTWVRCWPQGSLPIQSAATNFQVIRSSPSYESKIDVSFVVHWSPKLVTLGEDLDCASTWTW